MPDPDKIKKILPSLPLEPGVYLMKDDTGLIIYIGKASSLKKRVSSYFRKKDLDLKTRALLKFVSDIEYIVTDSEIEALILESSLIKKHKPKFNIRLKDDKRYPYIAVTLDEDYPRVIYTRRLKKNGRRYFGPYTDARAAKNSVSMINSIFRLKRCKKELPLKKNERPCLNYQIKKCSGVCTGSISLDDYRSLVKNAVSFLEGDTLPVIESLRNMMKKYSDSLEYEKASGIRDIIFDIQKISESQKVYLQIGMDQDYIGISIHGSEAIIILFEFRKGILLGRKISIFENAIYSDPDVIIRSFILDYYERAEIPQRIVARQKILDKDILQKYLTEKSKRKVAISTPESSDDAGIINLIQKNIDVIIADRDAGDEYQNRQKGLEELKEALNMDRIPAVMECFDISNLQGSDAVASMVCFRDGLPDKSCYRRYRIRGYESPDDPGMIHEVVARRFQHLLNEGLDIPDLMIVDGGKPQLSRALEASGNFEADIKIISIAKRFEEIYYAKGKDPIRLPGTSPALHIMQNIRDEAHRFAVEYHRRLRGKKVSLSILDKIPLGTKKKQILLGHFKSIDKIKKAELDEIKAINGIGNKTAEKIYDFFHA